MKEIWKWWWKISYYLKEGIDYGHKAIKDKEYRKTPGAYFEFFNREFMRKGSFVISRTIYYKDDNSKIIGE